MNLEKQREIARKGGKAAHEKGTAHEFTTDEARAAGRKGGERVSANRAHMAEIGRLGGKRSAVRRSMHKGQDQANHAKQSEQSNGEGQLEASDNGNGNVNG